MYELINGVQIKKKMYKGQPVVTLADIDGAHDRKPGTARKRFNDNKKHFIEGVDYFKVCASEIRTHKILDISPKAHEDIILVAESGYLMIVKSFNDELSWKVQRQLVNTYFRVNQITTTSDNAILLQIIENQMSLEQNQKRIEHKINALEKKVDSHADNIIETLFDMAKDVIANGFETLHNNFLK